MKKLKLAKKNNGHILQLLKKFVLNGWPDNKEVPIQTHNYFSYSDEINIEKNVLFRGKEL